MKSIRKRSTVDLAVDEIIKYIKSDALNVGDKLPSETSLCQELKISRTTIREAYRTLATKGYLDIELGRGAFVKSKDPNPLNEAVDWISSHRLQMSDYLRVRLSLDPLASSLAAENAKPEDIEELLAIQMRFVEAVQRKETDEMEKLDARFHARIAEVTKNDLLISLMQVVNYYCSALRRSSFVVEVNAHNAIWPHEQILTAIANHDPKRAANAASDHILQAYDDLCGHRPNII